jgi:trehalose-6-phosphate synthase
MIESNSSTDTTPNNLTYNHLKEYLKYFDKIPKVPIGVVCRPNVIEWCRNNLNKEVNKVRSEYGLYGIPLYTKINMDADYKEFYNYDELKEFLKEI